MTDDIFELARSQQQRADTYDADLIPWGVAVAVLWHFDTTQGPKPGGFEKALVAAIAHADTMNQARLALGFPDYVAACRWAMYEPDGILRLRAIHDGGNR